MRKRRIVGKVGRYLTRSSNEHIDKTTEPSCQNLPVCQSAVVLGVMKKISVNHLVASSI